MTRTITVSLPVSDLKASVAKPAVIRRPAVPGFGVLFIEYIELRIMCRCCILFVSKPLESANVRPTGQIIS